MYAWGMVAGSLPMFWSAGESGADEALQTPSSLQHRGLAGPILTVLSLLVQDRPDDVGDQVVGDPAFQFGVQGRDHVR
jgi:hypothetical protein